jgi:hypothetical protein
MRAEGASAAESGMSTAATDPQWPFNADVVKTPQGLSRPQGFADVVGPYEVEAHHHAALGRLRTEMRTHLYPRHMEQAYADRVRCLAVLYGLKSLRKLGPEAAKEYLEFLEAADVLISRWWRGLIYLIVIPGKRDKTGRRSSADERTAHARTCGSGALRQRR